MSQLLHIELLKNRFFFSFLSAYQNRSFNIEKKKITKNTREVTLIFFDFLLCLGYEKNKLRKKTITNLIWIQF